MNDDSDAKQSLYSWQDVGYNAYDSNKHVSVWHHLNEIVVAVDFKSNFS